MQVKVLNWDEYNTLLHACSLVFFQLLYRCTLKCMFLGHVICCYLWSIKTIILYIKLWIRSYYKFFHSTPHFIWRFYGSTYEGYILGCDIMLTGRYIPVFWENKTILKLEAAGLSKMGTTYQTTRYHILEDSKLQFASSGSLTSSRMS
jgi:hypothetical protein